MKYDLVILAAGLGSRLKSLTRNIPKAMIKYKGKRFIEIQLSNISEAHINKYIIVLGYKSDVLKKFLKKKFPNINFTFVYNKNFRSNNSGQSFFYAYKHIETNQYIHLNCDCLFSKSHFKKLIYSKYKNLISVRSDLNLGDKMENVETIKNRITKLTLKYSLKSKFKAYGISKISAHLSSLVLLIQPLAAALYGWLLLSESILPIQAIGGLIVLVAIYLAARNN